MTHPSKTKVKAKPTSSPRARLQLEALEQRDVPAASLIASLSTTGELYVEGTNYNDTIAIRQNASNLIGINNGNLLIRLSTGQYVTSVAASAVSKIRINGLGGNDTIDLGNFVTLYNFTGQQSITKSATIDGGLGNDIIYSGDGADNIQGNYGNDIIHGGDGEDIIYGSYGLDQLFGDAANDTIYGGNDNDLINGGTGDDTLTGNLGNDILQGDTGNDKLYGSENNDTLYGGTGLDELYGGIGNDVLYGEAGDDKLYGEDGLDGLDGGDGNDLLVGGKQRDKFVGGLGFDTYKDDFNLSSPYYSTAVPLDIAQGLLPNCQTLAAIASIAQEGGSAAITSMIRKVSAGVYEVKMTGVNPNSPWVRVVFDGTWTDNDPSPVGQERFLADSVTTEMHEYWFILMNRVRLAQFNDASGNPISTFKQYTTAEWNQINTNYGGRLSSALDALKQFTGKTNATIIAQPAVTFAGLQALLATTANVVASSFNGSGPNALGIINDHAYVVTKAFVSSGKQYVTLYNPWGQDRDDGNYVDAVGTKKNDGYITILFSDFNNVANFDTLESLK